eukprot:a2288_552.p2 GENE.a2288_552~~a2288_552.p2  ORF type:complete len:432 (-),score=185.28 a2288_552:57-1322(-)
MAAENPGGSSGGGPSDAGDNASAMTFGTGKKAKGAVAEHAFWDKQPVPRLDADIPEGTNEPIERVYENIKQDPYSLPEGYEWSDIVIDEPAQLTEVYDLLHENYVEDDDAMFRFDYSREFLVWALKPPGWLVTWHAGVRVSKSKKLVGFITAIPAEIVMRGTPVRQVEINFLCVHKKLRHKRLAPVLIKEITRRVHLQGIFQAVYTAGVELPRPVAKCQYFHRSLHPKKLVDIGFSYLRKSMTMKGMVKLYALPAEPLIPGIRAMRPDDVPACAALLRAYLAEKTLMYPVLSDEEFAHWVLPREGVVFSYVVPQADGRVTDFCSFYRLPSSVIGNAKYPTLYAAYSYYNVATSVTLQALMKDALIFAKAAGMDVFNALNLMENDAFLEELKFGPGDGSLHYYCYNWVTPQMDPSKVGLVLL